MPMLSSTSLEIPHVWVQRVEGDIWGGGRAKRACGKGTVDSQQGTSVGGSSYPCTKS
jgi:hypothetical protein